MAYLLKKMNGRTDKRTDGRADKRTDGRTNERTDGQSDFIMPQILFGGIKNPVRATFSPYICS